MFLSRTCQKKTLHTVQSQWQPRCQTARHGQLKSGVQTNQGPPCLWATQVVLPQFSSIRPFGHRNFSKWANITGSLHSRWMLSLGLKWIPPCGRTLSERGAFYWGMMALIQRLTPAARKPAGLFWLAVSFFSSLFFFLSTSLTFSLDLHNLWAGAVVAHAWRSPPHVHRVPTPDAQ